MSLENKKQETNIDPEPIKYAKSLRFKLTVIYSLILFVFSFSLVFGINLLINDYLNHEPLEQKNGYFMVPTPKYGIYFEFDQDQRQRIREIRTRDLVVIQRLSALSLIPMSVLSFALGYYISGLFLSPLNELRKKISSMKEKDLGSEVEIKTYDEIGMLAKSFNEMSIRLKEAFDSQTRFIQDASHELRTPLTIVQTNLDLATSNPNLSKKELLDAIKNAQSGMKRVRDLSERLLDLTNPENQNFEDKDIKEIITKQYEALKEYSKHDGIKFYIDLPSKSVIKKVDETSFGQAIFNLLENAIKYSKDSKKPTVKVKLSKNKNVIKITITDNGKGIPKEKWSRIFSRFYRADKSRSRESGGFGLGLAITKKIIEDHEGIIDFDSNIRGTKFTITLPK